MLGSAILNDQHRDRLLRKARRDFFALVHTAVPRKQYHLDGPRQALDSEWNKLIVERNAFDLAGVMEFVAAVQKAKYTKHTFHFGDIIELCHIKNSQLAECMQSFKGRCVFGGHDIRDEEGFLAVLSEQGTSASFQNAMKMMHAIGNGRWQHVRNYRRMLGIPTVILLRGLPNDLCALSQTEVAQGMGREVY